MKGLWLISCTIWDDPYSQSIIFPAGLLSGMVEMSNAVACTFGFNVIEVLSRANGSIKMISRFIRISQSHDHQILPFGARYQIIRRCIVITKIEVLPRSIRSHTKLKPILCSARNACSTQHVCCERYISVRSVLHMKLLWIVMMQKEQICSMQTYFYSSRLPVLPWGAEPQLDLSFTTQYLTTHNGS